jgi:hypothetical protein
VAVTFVQNSVRGSFHGKTSPIAPLALPICLGFPDE